MVNRKYLFIEGTTETSNGSLREGFHRLIEQKVKGNMPTISMGEDKIRTINKFKSSNNSKILCDLDAPLTEKENDLKEHGLIEYRCSVFYMVQEMESWFLSQPEILDRFYNKSISTKLPKKHAGEFSKPDEELQRLTKDTTKGTYHKVNHGVQLLKLLDADKLCKDFPDFKRLIEKLK